MFFSSGFNPVTLSVSINVSNSPADNTEFNESHLLFRLNNLKQALAKNSITETIGCIPLRTASKIVVNLKAADSGLLITKALGMRPDIRVTIIKINKNPDHIKNIHRINRIHGQLKGVEKMIVEKRYCLEILQQTRAITSAIKSLENNILN